MDDENEGAGLGSEARKRSMRAITADGMAYSVMAGLGDAYLPAALVLLGAGDFMIGLLAALPQFLGASLQFLSLSAMRIVRSRKILVMAGSALQALSWLGIAAMVFWPAPLSVEIIVALFSIGVGSALFINPAWSSWVADIVHSNERPAFFANRNKLMQLVLFVVIFGAGYAINRLEMGFSAAVAFSAVFFVAFAARALTVYYHVRTADVPYEIKLMNEIRLKHLFLLPAYKNELWFLAFVALMNFAVQFASPFFTPYMLHSLGMDVGALGALTAIAIITKIICFPYWGAAIDRFTNRMVLIATALAVPFVTFLWLFSTDFWMLALFQVFSGFVWAGYDLAVFNSALGLVGRDLRPSFISKYNAFSAFANGLGALAGGYFLFAYPGFAVLGFSGILLVFLLSSAMRLAVALIFAPHIARGRDVLNRHEDRAMVFKIVAVYPTQGAVAQVMNGWDFTRKIVTRSTESSGEMLKEGIEATGEIVKEGGRKLMGKLSRRGRL
ncbi:MAG: MFS transporter [Candidatus Micrarchaeia archaeon]|jgi:MFS family permease